MISLAQPTVNGEALTPNDAAQAITGRDYLSWSQVRRYRSCPRQWAFHYVEGAVPSFVPQALCFGSAFHSALQHHFERRMEGECPVLQELHDVFSERFSAAGSTDDEPIPVRYNKGDDEQSVRELAERMLASFLGSALADPEGEVIGIEESIRGSLAPDLPDFVAIVDLMLLDDDTLTVVDFKTARSRWSESQVTESAPQLQLYEQLVSGLAEGNADTIQLVFGVVTKARSPAVQALTVPSDPENGSASRLADQVRPVWQAIQSQAFYSNPSKMNCTTCPYQHLCPDSATG